jgi:hypothetical protein
MQSEGDIFGFCDILRISIPIFSGTKKEKKLTLFRWNRLAILSRIDLF